MATVQKQKCALRLASYLFYAGAHRLTETVYNDVNIQKDTALFQEMLASDFQRFCTSDEILGHYIERLNEEDLYPFGSEWPDEALFELTDLLIPPRLSFASQNHGEVVFRFRKGYRDSLGYFSANAEGLKQRRSILDHWLVLLLHSAFFASASLAAQNAENSKLYFSRIADLEQEEEPWTYYPQISRTLDNQLSREKKRQLD